jgi:choline dehydrogenase-like flavoprotein
MSFIDLSVASPSAVIQADFCIVGAGAAGIFLASRLLEKGKSVVLLEAGPVNAIDTESIGF